MKSFAHDLRWRLGVSESSAIVSVRPVDCYALSSSATLFEFFFISFRARFSATFFSIERTSSGIFFPNCF